MYLNTITTGLASDQQIKFLTRLLDTKVLNDEDQELLPNLQMLLDEGRLPGAEAEEWIVALKAREDKAGAKPANAASEKQVAFIEKLLGEKDLTDEEIAIHRQILPTLGKREASKVIDRLMAKPRKARQASTPKVSLEDGMYQVDGRIFKIQHAVHGSGNQYAKELIKDEFGGWSFEYAKGAIRNLKPEHKMSLEQAKEFGALYGTCCVCGRVLTDEGSIEAGIGPVCASKF